MNPFPCLAIGIAISLSINIVIGLNIPPTKSPIGLNMSVNVVLNIFIIACNIGDESMSFLPSIAAPPIPPIIPRGLFNTPFILPPNPFFSSGFSLPSASKTPDPFAEPPPPAPKKSLTFPPNAIAE